jgi:hypothetical protein
MNLHIRFPRKQMIHAIQQISFQRQLRRQAPILSLVKQLTLPWLPFVLIGEATKTSRQPRRRTRARKSSQIIHFSMMFPQRPEETRSDPKLDNFKAFGCLHWPVCDVQELFASSRTLRGLLRNTSERSGTAKPASVLSPTKKRRETD